MWFEDEDGKYEVMYEQWLESNCKCELEECACKGFEDWLEGYEDDRAEAAYERYLEEQCLMAE